MLDSVCRRRGPAAPVGHTDSPAMNLVRLRQLGLFPEAYNLRNSMRQSHESGILANATAIRRFLFGKPSMKFHLKASGFTDVETVSPTELADCLSSSWAKVGTEETLIISRSNKRANNFNAQIRSRVLFAEDAIQRGERLISEPQRLLLVRQKQSERIHRQRGNS